MQHSGGCSRGRGETQHCCRWMQPLGACTRGTPSRLCRMPVPLLHFNKTQCHDSFVLLHTQRFAVCLVCHNVHCLSWVFTCFRTCFNGRGGGPSLLSEPCNSCNHSSLMSEIWSSEMMLSSAKNWSAAMSCSEKVKVMLIPSIISSSTVWWLSETLEAAECNTPISLLWASRISVAWCDSKR